jgi:hypothetical protein
MAKPRLDDTLTADYLRTVLDYNPKTGIFIWRDRTDIRPGANCQYRGTVAGAHMKSGYVHIGINGRVRYAHRLAWLYVHGWLPPEEIDHINEIKSDNRIANLRVSEHGPNNIRSKARATSGAVGVYPAGASRWQAQIQWEGRVHYLGCFATIKEAKAVRDEAARKLHGKFARTD